MTAAWANCTGEARAKKCAHLTNAAAQAKSHAAQRSQEFLNRKSEWSKAQWKRVSPEDRLAIGAKLAEARRKKREERGLPPIAPKPIRPRKTTPEEFAAIRLANLKKGWEAMKARAADNPKPRKEKDSTKKRTRLITYNGESLTQVEWARKLGISQPTISARLKRGWPVEKALTVVHHET